MGNVLLNIAKQFPSKFVNSLQVLKCICQSSDVRRSSWRSLWVENEANVHFAYFIPPGKRIWWSKWGKGGENSYYNLTIQILLDLKLWKNGSPSRVPWRYTKSKICVPLGPPHIIQPADTGSTLPQIESQDNIYWDSHCTASPQVWNYHPSNMIQGWGLDSWFLRCWRIKKVLNQEQERVFS